MKAKKTRELYLTINCGCSPTVALIFDEHENVVPSDAKKIAKDIKTDFEAVLEGYGGKLKYMLDDGIQVTVHPRTDMNLKTKKQRDQKRQEDFQKFFDGASKFKIEPIDERIDKDPDKDKEGYWIVNGIRHSCLVWSKGAKEAIRLAGEKGGVGIDWELCSVTYAGERPEVVEF